MTEPGQTLTTGQTVTFWAARLSAALYFWGLSLQLRRRWPLERAVNSAALAVYLLHVICAFQFFYSWSHATALRETARQTEALFGVNWGGGLYLNYALTAVWLGDCLTSWLRPERRISRPAWADWAISGFLVFMFVNGSVVVWILRAIRGGASAPVH